MENKLTILHLTDIHISYLEKPEVTMRKWKNLIHNILSMSSAKIDLVAITGDITSHGEAREFHMALSYLNWFSKACMIPKKKIVFCPGNHDADKGHEQSTFCHYDYFIRAFYGEDIVGSGLPEVGEFSGLLHKKVHIWSVNTNLTTSYVFYDNASIPEEDGNKILERCDEKDVNILLMHHPSINIANDKMLRQLCDKMDIVLCGHLHPNKSRVQVSGKATVVTGIAMTPHLETIQRGCQLIMMNRGIVTVEPVYDQNLYHIDIQATLQKCGS